MSTPSDAQKQIVFIQDDVPPLQTGLYTLTATEVVPNQQPCTFEAAATFIVQGERFKIGADEIVSVFPPDLANGEFDGDLPHVVFSRRTLPWQRDLKAGDPAFEGYAWLAVLLFNDDEAPVPQAVQAQDLVPAGLAITVIESSLTGVGTLPPTTLSYGNATLNPMGYGERPDEPCTVIDIPIALFNRIAPAVTDVQYLAHIREVDVADGTAADAATQQFAVVAGNRIPAVGSPSHAFLVSLEDMAAYLPAEDGAASSAIPATTELVRLLTYTHWIFTANDLDQKLAKLLENVNTPPAGQQKLTTLQLPIDGSPPSAPQVTQALASQAAGSLSAAEATVLVQNALMMGYVPFAHHLRHGGQTVSWYRGPLAPFAVDATLAVPIAGPDAANGYNPYTGMFDVSYGAAWQLGQLLALQNTGLASSLLQWKEGVQQAAAVLAEQGLLDSLLQNTALFESFLRPRADAVRNSVAGLPQDITDWFGRLATLQGVPFNYLVPDEALLPQESLRFFHLDLNWIDALADGAFSIGRATAGEAKTDQTLFAHVRNAVNRPMQRNALAAGAGVEVSGFLLRSQAVSGWPNLRIKGYGDPTQTDLLPKLCLTTLARDVMFCLFEGVLQMLVIEEPPEQLHMGVEPASSQTYSTPTLRAADGIEFQSDPHGTPSACDPTGTKAVACVPMRADGQTLQIAQTAAAIATKLTNDFSLTFPNGFTSAEFALEMNKGVVMVEYANASG